jgi:alkylhydroperoxidase family enzyme
MQTSQRRALTWPTVQLRSCSNQRYDDAYKEGKAGSMEPRLSLYKANAQAMRPMSQMGQAVHESGLDEALVHLIDIRASQINGCGY